MRPKLLRSKSISVIVTDRADKLRGGVRTKRVEINAEQLAENVNVFLVQMQRVVMNAPQSVGGFALDELEISAEITAKGQVLLLGVGGEASAKGGITFKFKRKTQL